MSKFFDELELRCYNKDGELIDPAIDFNEVQYIYVGTVEAMKYIQELDGTLNIDALGYWVWDWHCFVNAEDDVKALNEKYAPFNLNFTF